jgi:hypothetical protein
VLAEADGGGHVAGLGEHGDAAAEAGDAGEERAVDVVADAEGVQTGVPAQASEGGVEGGLAGERAVAEEHEDAQAVGIRRTGQRGGDAGEDGGLAVGGGVEEGERAGAVVVAAGERGGVKVVECVGDDARIWKVSAGPRSARRCARPRGRAPGPGRGSAARRRTRARARAGGRRRPGTRAAGGSPGRGGRCRRLSFGT